MTTPAGDLLSRLASGVLPPGVKGPIPTSVPQIDSSGTGFGAMLSLARAGQLRTGLPLDLSADPGPELTQDQHQRLSAAMDRLAASDAQHALVLLDEHALLTDPNARRVTGRADLESGTPVVGINAMATAPRGDVTPSRSGSVSECTNLLRALHRTHVGLPANND